MSARLFAAAGLIALALAGCGGGADDGQRPAALGSGEAGGGPGSPEFGDNVVRIPGVSASDVAAAAILAAYPPEEAAKPNGWMIFPGDDWHAAANAAQFASRPVDAGLVPIESDFLPTAAADLVGRVEPPGFPRGEGVQAVLVGSADEEVIEALEAARLDLTQIPGISPAQVSSELVPYRGGWAHEYSDTIVVVSATARDYALPAMSWSAFSGDTVVFVGPSGVPEDTKSVLAQREELRLRKPTMYLVGPRSVIPDAVAAELAPFGEVRRVAGEDPVETAVELARYRDQDTAFGWGLDRGPANLLFASLDEPGDMIGALNLSGAGPRAPLLLLDDSERLPAPVAAYLGELRNRAGNQGYVAGDRQSVSAALLAEIDMLLEPGAPTRAATKRSQNG